MVIAAYLATGLLHGIEPLYVSNRARRPPCDSREGMARLLVVNLDLPPVSVELRPKAGNVGLDSVISGLMDD